MFDGIRTEHPNLTGVAARRSLEYSDDVLTIRRVPQGSGTTPDFDGTLRDGRRFVREVYAPSVAVTNARSLKSRLLRVKAPQTRGNYERRELFVQVPNGSDIDAVIEGAAWFEKEQYSRYGSFVSAIVLDHQGLQIYPQ
jgi:hypothetical protein